MIDVEVKENNAASSKQHCVLPSKECLPDIPMVAISGFSDSGKTTLIEKLIPELKSRGYRVASIKHSHHELALDSDKDTERHLKAGSVFSLVVAQNRLVLVKPLEHEPSLHDILYMIGDDFDILICEGFKYTSLPKIEVCRGESDQRLSTSNVVAVVTDKPIDTDIPQYASDGVNAIADLLERDYILPKRERLSIDVNNVAVPLIEFPHSIITKTILGMLTALKGVNNIHSVQINLRHQDKGSA